jgi:hypothetical protein
MAIKNASDLLVYKKTTPAQPQITRIKVKSSTPIKDFTSGQDIKVNNITDASGDISDGVAVNLFSNTGNQVVFRVGEALSTNYGYNITGQVVDGSFTYIDVTNGANGPVPTLELVDFEAEFKAGAVEIVVLQSGQFLVYQPIAYSTSASIGVSKDLRDITTKDSQGWQENAKGLGSFELSTDALWDVNNAVGVESATEDLIVGDSVDVKFSDRVRNLVATEEVYGDSSYWALSNVTLTKHLEDPFGQFTAAQVNVSSDGTHRSLRYTAPIELVEGKRITWSLYLKAFSATANSCEFRIIFDSDSSSDVDAITSIEKIEGNGTVSSTSGAIKKITGLSTSSWTRVKVTTDSVVSGSDLRGVNLYIYPGGSFQTQTTADKVITASWQVETSTSATDYQNPTEVDCYQGKAFVNSVSVDAGVEDNATYSASFTGTSEIFINGLGHELVEDPYFDDPSYWTASNGGVVEGGYAKFDTTQGSAPQIQRNDVFIANEKYCLEYTVHTSTAGTITLIDGSGSDDVVLPSSVGTHKVYVNPGISHLSIKRTSATTLVWLSFISVKQVFS